MTRIIPNAPSLQPDDHHFPSLELLRGSRKADFSYAVIGHGNQRFQLLKIYEDGSHVELACFPSRKAALNFTARLGKARVVCL
jgi:hypothetical protein